MHLPRSTYYDAPPVKADDAEIVAAITAICNEFEAYGYRRVGAELRHQGIAVNSKKVRRLMREHDLQPKRRRGFVATTDSDHDGPIVPDLARDSGRKVRDVMTCNVWTVTLDASLAEVVHLMERHNPLVSLSRSGMAMAGLRATSNGRPFTSLGILSHSSARSCRSRSMQ